MDYTAFLRRVPKVELHCHLEGTVRAATVAELARKHGITLPDSDVDSLYDYDTIEAFLDIFGLVASTLIDAEDFERVAFESLQDGQRLGNLKYREMFFNPTLHTRRGVPYRTVVDGLVAGIRRAERELGVGCRLIADVYRQDSPETALAMVEEVLAHRPDEVIGLGMDGAEAPDPPERFVAAFARARAGGLRLTSHACEDAPPKNIVTCLDVLGCERIDHGYHILADAAVVRRALDEGLYFTCCPTATARVYGWPDLSRHPIGGMVKAGLNVTLNSDDPTMFHTDIGREFVDLCTALDYGPEQVRQFCLNSVDGSWLDDSDKSRLRREMATEFDALASELTA